MLTKACPPLDSERIFDPIQFPENRAVLAAYSGGGDSTALLLLAHGYFKTRGRANELVAVTVDHGLREASTEEARRAGEICASLGLRHVIKTWSGHKPVNGVQEAAREMRYRLLFEAAGEANAGLVLTGHTLDDQTETIAMRSARGEGRGLSGIAPATLYCGQLWFVRPLLTTARRSLRDYLEERGAGWLEDPSNRDPRFERARVRLAGRKARDGVTDEHRLAFQMRCREAEEAAASIADDCQWHFNSEADRLSALCLTDASVPGFRLALSAVLSRVGNTPHLPPEQTIVRALDFAGSAPNGAGITLSGCLMTKGRAGIEIAPEKRNTRVAGYGYDTLLASPDYPLASALAARTGGRPYPAPPLHGYLV
ncbi:tRNA lysidine(34) synthetase TilS [Oricola cellulosilytica]|uniref:tRNA(Ile)-lysidine synthase n=1 Tax=Oricola cellulosilytica TaxID=1429082 RepID=A0A4R0PF62_9HYPH|nr:tRNA lysidine(34) synthetase TilS [Oricola cellulosilytica]TCD15433.1 tRNA lysidine(34) synthetase TilS [Oricola cellulosilytica]